jgi:hypothetical protein
MMLPLPPPPSVLMKVGGGGSNFGEGKLYNRQGF